MRLIGGIRDRADGRARELGAMDLQMVLANPKVAAVRFEGDQQLAAVFIRAFQDKGNEYPVDFDEAWNFLGYSTKANALRKVKRGGFKEEIDFKCVKGGVVFDTDGSYKGHSPDKYYMTTRAFEKCALSAKIERGSLVRDYFLAVKQAYFKILDEKDAPDVMQRATKRHRKLVAEHYPELTKALESKIMREHAIRDQLASRTPGARVEVRCAHGRIDILTDAFVIEVKHCSEWKAALGQCLAYRESFPRHRVKMALFGFADEVERVDVDEVLRLCGKYQVGVEVVVETEQTEDGKYPEARFRT